MNEKRNILLIQEPLYTSTSKGYNMNTDISKKSISSIISEYIRLSKAGNVYKGECPFCPSPKRTLIIDDNKSIYYCTEDGGSGDAILFLMRLKDLSYEEAIIAIKNESGSH